MGFTKAPYSTSDLIDTTMTEINSNFALFQQVTAKDGGYTITTSDNLQSYSCNSASDQIFTLPSVGTSDVGLEIEIFKIGAGKVTIQAVDTDTIEDSSATGTIYCSDTTYAYIKLKLITASIWCIKEAKGTWTTT